MHRNAIKCNETLSKWCKNKHGASKIMDTLETYQSPCSRSSSLSSFPCAQPSLWAFGGGALGGYEEIQERREDKEMAAAERQRAGKQ
jgi:hypothetical protein